MSAYPVIYGYGDPFSRSPPSNHLTLSALISVDATACIAHVLGPPLLVVTMQSGAYLALGVQIVRTRAPDLQPRNDDLRFESLVAWFHVRQSVLETSLQELLF